jgi:hypothetical protein
LKEHRVGGTAKAASRQPLSTGIEKRELVNAD